MASEWYIAEVGSKAVEQWLRARLRRTGDEVAGAALTDLYMWRAGKSMGDVIQGKGWRVALTAARCLLYFERAS